MELALKVGFGSMAASLLVSVKEAHFGLQVASAAFLLLALGLAEWAAGPGLLAVE